mmetsp:Transcript_9160/g.28217  ORF Transcript_9160/g.28217 Transcript_9160/m.28217 type:complete len:210 (+) Transcript_9160:832-1461(+)
MEPAGLDEGQPPHGALLEPLPPGRRPGRLGALHRSLDLGLRGTGRGRLGCDGAKRTGVRRPMGGLHNDARRGGELPGWGIGARAARRTPRGPGLRLRPQQEPRAALGGRDLLAARGPAPRRWRGLPLVHGRRLREPQGGAPALPAGAAAAQRSHVRAPPLARGRHGGAGRVELRRGLRPRHHRRPQRGQRGLDRLEPTAGPARRPQPCQ